VLSRFSILGRDPNGTDFVWELVVVGCLDHTGLVIQDHVFPAEQWDEALAKFDEWSTGGEPPAVPPLENAATRTNERYQALLAEEGFAVAKALLRSDYAFVDHRWSGVAPDASGRDAFVDHVRSSIAAGFMNTDVQSLAIRGDRLLLYRWSMSSEAGDVVQALAVGEVDADGLATRAEVFDTKDLARAAALLDEWYLEGEGAELAWMVGPSLAFWRSYNVRDWAGLRAVVADEMTLVDHRLASAGTTIQSADQFIAYAQAMVDLVPDIVAFEAEYLALGQRWALTRQMAYGTSSDGAEVERPSLILAELTDGRFSRTETFAPEQLDEALARFTELEAT
jgi:hypothetical protein